MEHLVIEKVRQRPSLYCTALESKNMNLKKRHEAWIEIGKELNLNPDIPKNCWTKLRRCYANAINRRMSLFKQGVEKYAKWKYEKEMEFLLPHMDIRNLDSLGEGFMQGQNDSNTIKEAALVRKGQTSDCIPEFIPSKLASNYVRDEWKGDYDNNGEYNKHSVSSESTNISTPGQYSPMDENLAAIKREHSSDSLPDIDASKFAMSESTNTSTALQNEQTCENSFTIKKEHSSDSLPDLDPSNFVNIYTEEEWDEEYSCKGGNRQSSVTVSENVSTTSLKCSPQILGNFDETDLFFLSMSLMTKKLAKSEQTNIKLLLSGAVLQAESRHQESQKQKTNRHRQHNTFSATSDRPESTTVLPIPCTLTSSGDHYVRNRTIQKETEKRLSRERQRKWREKMKKGKLSARRC